MMIIKESRLKQNVFTLVLGILILIFGPGFGYFEENVVSASTGLNEIEMDASALDVEDNEAGEDILSPAFSFYPLLREDEATAIMDAVEKYASQFDIPEELILAVIATESRFNSRCRGSLDEIGLMQIRYRYANGWARGLGEAGFASPEELFDIDTNIRYGTYILFYNLNRFDGDLKKALVAYNAGETYVANKIRAGHALPLSYVEQVSKAAKDVFSKDLF